MLNLLPWAHAHGATIAAVLSDNGREFCGRPDRHPYELFLPLEDMAHKTTQVRRPQSNGIVERLHRTLLDEHFRIEGRRAKTPAPKTKAAGARAALSGDYPLCTC